MCYVEFCSRHLYVSLAVEGNLSDLKIVKLLVTVGLTETLFRCDQLSAPKPLVSLVEVTVDISSD